MRIIFLDIDGVLNSTDWARRRGPYRPAISNGTYPSTESWELDLYRLDPACISRLNILIQETGAVLVLSSTWRKDTPLKRLIDLFRQRTYEYNGGRFVGNFLGCTPILSGSRGTEIQAWLDLLGENRQPDGIVILDDDTDMEHHIGSLIRIDPEVGLQDQDVAEAIRKLTLRDA